MQLYPLATANFHNSLSHNILESHTKPKGQQTRPFSHLNAPFGHPINEKHYRYTRCCPAITPGCQPQNRRSGRSVGHVAENMAISQETCHNPDISADPLGLWQKTWPFRRKYAIFPTFQWLFDAVVGWNLDAAVGWNPDVSNVKSWCLKWMSFYFYLCVCI